MKRVKKFGVILLLDKIEEETEKSVFLFILLFSIERGNELQKFL